MKGPFQLRRHLVAVAVAGVIFAVMGCKNSDPHEAILTAPIEIGKGIGDLQVHQSTLGQVTTELGDKFERSEITGSFGSPCVDGVCSNDFKKFVDINLEYKELGLTFVFRKIEGEDVKESDLKLRFIRIVCAKTWRGCKFQGKTDRGITLKSLRKDVREAHGANTSWTGRQGTISSRNGINFAFASKDGKLQDTDPVESIDIFAPEDFGAFGHRSI